MAQYINKSTLANEIKKRIKETESMLPKFDQFWAGQISAFKGVLKILNTLEVKDNYEVKDNDVMEEMDFDDYSRFFKEHPDYNDGYWGFEETWEFAQYCYTLGLKAK